MKKYCPMCKAYTNCTDNCISCMEEERNHEERARDDDLYDDLLMEQREQM